MFVDGNFGHAFGFTELFTIVSMATINVIALPWQCFDPCIKAQRVPHDLLHAQLIGGIVWDGSGRSF
jgi:hypothetical protein